MPPNLLSTEQPDKGADEPAADVPGVQLRFIDTNGIRVHVAEASSAEGPLVVLCHGFPETWYSWRHQLTALAEAGYHVVAPDQRGFGKTDRPEPIDEYSIFHTTGDVVGLVQALGKEQAVIVGHDWGAVVAWHAALLRPDMFRGVVLLSVPYSPRQAGNVSPLDAVKSVTPKGKVFYQVFIHDEPPGPLEAVLENDVRASVASGLYTLSGDAPPEARWSPIIDLEAGELPPPAVPPSLPAWLTERDIDFVAAQFKESGFRGGLNWYRNIDRNWRLTGFLAGAKLRQPTLFVSGDKDPVAAGFMQPAYEALEQHVPNLTKKVLLPGSGHWVQQENAAEVNRLLLEFLESL
jgi:pimeloyl-ACP methyl ester carboxylesterase